MKNNFAVIILASGKGTRMGGTISKVLYEIAGKTIIQRTLDTLKALQPAQIVMVVGYKKKDVIKTVGKSVTYALDEKQIGTGDATRLGLAKVKKSVENVMVINGDDSALYKPETIQEVLELHTKEENTLTFVTLEPDDPTGLGRVVRKNGKVVGVVEERDATEKQKKIKETNDGLYVFKRDWLEKNVKNIKKSEISDEYYLLDLIEHALKGGQKISTYKLKDPQEWHGINTQQELFGANLKAAKNIHIMGIAGAGAAAVAGIAKAYGFNVSGCDINPESPYVKNLDVKIEKGHSKNHATNVDLLVLSPAVEKFDANNEEIKAAKKQGIPTLTWQEFQGKYLQIGKFVVTAAGAYGKSTTTAMVAQILIDANMDPTCEIGAKVTTWESNFKVGNSMYYVCESDEYNDNFLNYHPDIAVLLNVGWDHPDFFKTKQDVLASFQKFINNIKPNGILVIPNDPEVQQLAKTSREDIKIVNVGEFGPLDLQIIGNFRKDNANAALTVASLLNIDIEAAKKSLEDFKGVGRRLEAKGEFEGVIFYDDYAVQPKTVLATSNALKDKFKQERVVLVFEPHTFSRIETFFDEFVKSLQNSKVDQVLVCDVYAAREKGDNKKLAQKIAQAIGLKAVYTGTIEESAKYIKKNLGEFDVVCSMGAGNSYKIYDLVTK
ncbi:MAG TPA: sugar phosphate nucleotidyltransferase [Candidatus Saccharimonadales bacterium]|nr:sugar phosphate nucleotidyltransferase [Candidatus Saccharimonadales bacterium]